MNRTLCSILSITCLWLLLAGCGKERSFENGAGTGPGPGSGTAVFAWTAPGSACPVIQVSGEYNAGEASDATDLAAVTVEVTHPGTWTYTTTTFNGLKFSGSGTFTATGTQVLLLQAQGTPSEPGLYTFSLPAGTNTCHLNIDVGGSGSGNPGGGSGGNGNVPEDAEFYYKATIGGQAFSEFSDGVNDVVAGSGINGLFDVAPWASVHPETEGSGDHPAGRTALYITKGLLPDYLNVTPARVHAFFAPGTYAYVPQSGFQDHNGVEVEWVDGEGKLWSTKAGSADQTGSHFEILSVVDAPDAVGQYYVTVKMRFTCKLYNEETGAMKLLTNGEMAGSFGEF
ncbi:MAG TPA: hypothetical protein VHK69_04895 [Chitinophagaceae bacterium]|jgi:hypothetical protein|nr:hypothetical protein [Chitinophagaceae bacterium]